MSKIGPDMRAMSDVEYYESGQAHRDMYDDLMKVRAENERLRAALTHIMELGYHSLDPDVDKRMTELAREALK
jgi:hypothetical protein